MTATIIEPPGEIIHLSGISWQTYETLLEELSDRRLRVTYNQLSGAEPDECFYIYNINAVRGKKRLDLTEDPAPDLVVEIDVTSSSSDRLQVYADLGVAEVWIYNGESLAIHQLQNNTYVCHQKSQFFANLPILEIARFLQQAETIDYLELVKEFRHWVKTQIK